VARAKALEAARLSAQATLIEPALLSPELLRQATGIDGAVLFDPDGTCHALGVILDGTATAKETDPAARVTTRRCATSRAQSPRR
jgi:hypothetical protein